MAHGAYPKTSAILLTPTPTTFRLSSTPKTKKGYFSSNRTGGKGNDDIYSYTRLNTVMSGIVVDCKTQEPIEGADVELSENGKK